MKKRLASAVALLLILASATTSAALTEPPAVGGTLPAVQFPKPADSAGLSYLGLAGTGTFSAGQVKAQALIIQIFSMYCPYCQKDAPNVNRLYGLIEKNPALNGKIKIIGIGAGNTSFEVATFRKKYKVEFPLIPDADFKIYKVIGEVRTPYFIVVKLHGPRPLEVVYSRLGGHDDVDAFLAEIIKAADVK
ncbi:MAG: redoxin domain-containing protein [Deltaproteobacteria bacterium]|nr:redoxin domain-containing protein [Deltaproteobacteria bacterium]